MKIYLFLLASLMGMVVPLQGQMAVYDSANQATAISNHAESLSKWTEQINKATEQVNKLNDMINQLNDVQGLIGKGMESVGIDPSITATMDLAKAANDFGQSLQTLQHSGGNVTADLEKLRQTTSDPGAWQRYVTTSKSYEATQKAQKDYDDQKKKIAQERQKAQAQLKAAKSLGETQKAQASLSEIQAAERSLTEERKRAFEEQQANHIENQNQKEAWEQACRDWTLQNARSTSADRFMNPKTKANP